MFRIKDDNTVRNFAFITTGTKCFRNLGTLLVTSSAATPGSGKFVYIGCVYNLSATTWDIVAYGQEA